MQTFFIGDTVSFDVELAHNFYLGDAWALFRRREEAEIANRPVIPLDAAAIREIRRFGTEILSRVEFEVALSKRRHIPGVYDLEGIRGLPPETPRGAMNGIELGAPEVSFRVVGPPDQPSARVQFWDLGTRNGDPRRLN